MSARTAAQHTPAELRYVGCDDLTGIVTFAADSASVAGKVNHVSYDTATGATLCDCKGAECGRACWHADLAPIAWQRHPAAQDVRWLTDDLLLAYGRKVAGMLTIYRARAGRALPMDALAVVAARWEWRRRAAGAAAPLLALPVADRPLAA